MAGVRGNVGLGFMGPQTLGAAAIRGLAKSGVGAEALQQKAREKQKVEDEAVKGAMKALNRNGGSKGGGKSAKAALPKARGNGPAKNGKGAGNTGGPDIGKINAALRKRQGRDVATGLVKTVKRPTTVASAAGGNKRRVQK